MAYSFYLYSDEILDSHDYEFHQRWGSFFYEFHNLNYVSSLYYAFFFIRRILFAFFQIFLNDYLEVQTALNAVSGIMIFIYVVHKKPLFIR